VSRPTLKPDSRRLPSRRSGRERADPVDEVRSALISAVCHAHQNELHDGAPPFLTPMPLERVVEVLGSRGNDLTRILGAGWLLDNPLRVETLGPYANMLLRDEERSRIAFPADLPGSVSFDPRKPDWIDHTENVEPTRFGYFADQLLGTTPCGPTQHRLAAWLNPQSLVTNVVAMVDVTGRQPAHYQKFADPRGWETNASLFFKESKICRLVDGDFATRPNPSTIGDTDYNGLLLEHVSLGFAPWFPMDALNVLNVDCGATRSSPTFKVSLHAGLETDLGLSWARGGLDVDSGEFSARPAGSSTRLLGTKVARFAERDVLGLPIGRLLNLFAPFSLAALMSILIFGGACL
jgi:hypothetical protein